MLIDGYIVNVSYFADQQDFHFSQTREKGHYILIYVLLWEVS